MTRLVPTVTCVPAKFMSTQNLRMGPLLGLGSLQVLSVEVKPDQGEP